MLELVGDSTLDGSGRKLNSVAVIFEYQLTLKSDREAVGVLNFGVAVRVLGIVILLPDRLVFLELGVLIKLFEYLFDLEQTDLAFKKIIDQLFFLFLILEVCLGDPVLCMTKYSNRARAHLSRPLRLASKSERLTAP